MPELALSQGILFLIYGAAGCGFGVLFHLFALLEFMVRTLRWRWVRILCDILFWLIFTVVVYVMNFNLTYGEVRPSLLFAMALGAALVWGLVKRVCRFFSKHHKKYATPKQQNTFAGR